VHVLDRPLEIYRPFAPEETKVLAVYVDVVTFGGLAESGGQ
jgi:hypothetical protein